MKIPLSRIAHARSGDKGDTSNIGVIAFDAAALSGAGSRSDAGTRKTFLR